MEAKSTKRKLVDSDDKHTVGKKIKTSKHADDGARPSATKRGVKKYSPTNVEAAQTMNKYRTLTDLPAELMYEIVRDLRPRDLVNLCEVSVWIWRTLCNEGTVSIWKKSREREDVQMIPPGMNEYYWAKLLLGTRCMDCGKNNVITPEAVDFYIRRRLCKPCKKAKYIEHGTPNNKKFGPGLKLCKFTRVNWHGTHNPRKAYSWKDDVIEQKKKVTDIRKNKLVKQRLAEYTASRKALVKKIQTEAERLQKVHANYLEDLKAERGDKVILRYRHVVRILHNHGYKSKDFPPKLYMYKLVRQKANLPTAPCWYNIREVLVPQIEANQSYRELTESVTARVTRRQMVDELYAQYKFDHVSRTEWKFMPIVHNVCNLPPFAALVDAEPARTVSPADFGVLMEDLDQSLISTYEETRTRLRQRVLAANDSFLSELTHTRQFRTLELACIVFRCGTCKTTVFGWDDVRLHCCNDDHERLGLSVERNRKTGKVVDNLAEWTAEFPYTFEYWQEASTVLRLVLESLGMDPKTTTTPQLNADPNLRLECWCSGTSKHFAFKWRMMVWHFLQRAGWHENHMKPLTGKVPEVYLPQIIAEEDKHDLKDERFACSHCTSHLRGGKLIAYWQIVKHLYREHDIYEPQIDVDYVRLPNDVRSEYHHFADGICFEYDD